MLYLSRDTTRVLLYCVEHEKSGALTGLECDLVQLPLGILLAGRRQSSINATIVGIYGIIRKSLHEHMVEGSCGRERCGREREFNTRKEDLVDESIHRTYISSDAELLATLSCSYFPVSSCL